MTPFAAATNHYLHTLAADALRQLDGIPESDLNTWLPRDGMRDINPFFALATHLVGSGEYWVLHAAGRRPLQRDRDAEFLARGALGDLQERYARWLSAVDAVLADLTDADLGRITDHLANQEHHLTVADCLVHAIEHTAMHVGHLQIQRQLWDAERSAETT